jgi:hypothetical protein
METQKIDLVRTDWSNGVAVYVNGEMEGLPQDLHMQGACDLLDALGIRYSSHTGKGEWLHSGDGAPQDLSTALGG